MVLLGIDSVAIRDVRGVSVMLLEVLRMHGMNERMAKRMSDEFEFRKLLTEIDFVSGLKDLSQDSLEIPNEVKAKQGMKEYVYDEFDDVMYDTDDGASISRKEGDIETQMGDEEVKNDNDVDWKHYCAN
nr:hypothetical protein [Tanacetum cinerariifolium]